MWLSSATGRTPVTIDLVIDHLSPSELAVVRQLEAHVRTYHQSALAPFLFEQLQNGRAAILDVNSVEFKGLTKWQ